MKEAVKCSISGIAFNMDVDAYEELKSYLDALKAAYKESPDGIEIVADIEARIAELILTTQENLHVVERPLILNIIAQMGAPEDISDMYVNAEHSNDEPRIPRRLYRDTINAKLGGVCAGIGRHFDIDPTWVRLAFFAPLLLMAFSWVPYMHWTASIMGNLFGVFVLCYLIMWFAVPVARTARQRLEMSGERITVRSIHDQVQNNLDPDSKAKPIVAEAISVFGKVVLILLKIFLGALVLGLIMAASALIIGIFTIIISGPSLFNIDFPTLWVPILGIFIALIPVGMLIYVFMCLIASRKPSGKTILVIFLLWLASIIGCVCVTVSERVDYRFLHNISVLERFMTGHIMVNGNSVSLESLLETDDANVETVVDLNSKTLRISVPDEQVEIRIDGPRASISTRSTQEPQVELNND